MSSRAPCHRGIQAKLIAALVQFVDQNKFAGVCVDFEEPTRETHQPASIHAGAGRDLQAARLACRAGSAV